MRVSIIVPLYNKAAYIGRSLRSITAQTFHDIEVLVVDDGSTDGSGAIARAFPDERVRVISQPNAGPGAARNRGIAEARGELIAFLDADDEWMPEYLSENIQALDNAGPGVAAVTSGWLEHPPTVDLDARWRERGLTEGPYRVTPATPPTLLVHLLAYISPCTTILRTNLVRNYGGFYAKDRCVYGEDAFLFLKLLLRESVLVRLAPRVLVYRDASQLSATVRHARPVEPFLVEPDELRAECPPALRPLLEQFLAIRAFKTACVLGYWGEWQRARELRSRFRTKDDTQLPFYWPSIVGATPLAGWAGQAWRTAQRLARRSPSATAG